MKKIIEDQSEYIMSVAKRYGQENDFLFMTTFARYQRLLKTLDQLEEILDDAGLLTSKEYVKGRENIVAHPGIAEYNRTCNSANQTATTLLKIIKQMSEKKGGKKEDELLKALGVE